MAPVRRRQRTALREHGTQVVDAEGPLPGRLIREFVPNAQRSVPEISPVRA